MSDETKRLLLEAQKADYGLRSTFFYRKLKELGFTAFHDQVEELARVGNAYRWEERAEWGISESAWNQIQDSHIEPIRVFAHPLICMQNPRLLAYYRSVAAISQKGAKRLALPPIEQFEKGARSALSHDQALVACRLFNRHISAIIDSALTFSERDIEALLLASAGAQIDGAWRNAIGEEGEAVVRRLIVSGFLKEGKIAAFHKRGGGVVAVSDIDETDIVAHLATYQGFTLTNGTAIVFSSEPDVSLLDTDGKLLAAMEIKAGKDPAGALERLGAAQKSFTHAHRENPGAIPITPASLSLHACAQGKSCRTHPLRSQLYYARSSETIGRGTLTRKPIQRCRRPGQIAFGRGGAYRLSTKTAPHSRFRIVRLMMSKHLQNPIKWGKLRRQIDTIRIRALPASGSPTCQWAATVSFPLRGRPEPEASFRPVGSNRRGRHSDRGEVKT